MKKIKKFMGTSLATAIVSTVLLVPNASAIDYPHYATSNDRVAQATASISIPNENGGRSNCTGVLVAKQWVMTAAHCFEKTGKAAELRKGGKFPTNKNPGPFALSSKAGKDLSVQVNIGANRKTAQKLTAVEGYSQPNGADLTLLKLNKSASATPVTMNLNHLTQDEDVRIYGWSTVSNNDDRLRYATGNTAKIRTQLVTILDRSFIEPGDSGGPMVTQKDNKLVGITKGNGTKTQMGYSVALSEYKDWINTTMRK